MKTITRFSTHRAHQIFFSTLYFIILFNLILTQVGCSGRSVDENDPQAVFNDAEEDVNDKKYAMALEKMRTVKNKFPYSHLSTLAQLRIADIEYLDESFIESAAAYEAFKDLHPKYENADYVVFRIGESYFYQLPSTIDRDLTPAQKAIDAYQELIKLYPKSEFVSTAREHMTESRNRQSQKESYIAEFYYIREIFDSAATRYEKIVMRFSDTPVEEQAYVRWGESLEKVSESEENIEKQNLKRAEAKHAYELYLQKFPSGKYEREAKKATERLGSRI